MKYYFILGVVLGICLLIYSIKELKKLKRMTKMTGIVMGRHSVMRRDDYVLRVQLNINGKEIEKDLNYYSAFFRKGKKISVYYDSNNNSIDCAYGNIFVLFLGIIFLLGSIYLIFVL